MKRLKKISVLVAILFFASVFIVGIYSCQSEVQKESSENSASVNYMKCYEENIKGILSHNISSHPHSRSLGLQDSVGEGKFTTVYVDFPEDVESADAELKKISNMNDILYLTNVIGADISLKKNEFYSDSILLSDQEATQALNPLIQESKKYLYDKGFTEEDIQDMLTENNADETQLIPFVLVCVEEERNEEAEMTSNVNNMPFSLFAMSAKAETVDWKKAGTCALEALGFDFGFGLYGSNLKKWSVALMKRTFKVVLSKALGPIGVILFIADFSWCYYRSETTMSSSASSAVW